MAIYIQKHELTWEVQGPSAYICHNFDPPVLAYFNGDFWSIDEEIVGFKTFDNLSESLNLVYIRRTDALTTEPKAATLP